MIKGVGVNGAYNIPYSRKLSREKTLVNWWKSEICGEDFRGLFGVTSNVWVWPSIFTEKTFMDRPKTLKFAKVFSLESFPLYGICYMSNQNTRWPSKLLLISHCSHPCMFQLLYYTMDSGCTFHTHTYYLLDSVSYTHLLSMLDIIKSVH